MCIELSQEASNVLSPKPSVTPIGNTVCPQCPTVTPSPHCIGMDMEKPGYFSYREHRPHLVTTYHILPYLSLN